MKSAPKTFGIGFGKTGSQSIQAALQLVGLSCKHWPATPENLSDLKTATFGWPVMNDCDCLVDFGLSCYYRQLDRKFPNSRFILTVRNKQDWLRSTEVALSTRPYRDDRWLLGPLYYSHVFDREHFSDVWDMTHEHINTYFRERSNLLTMDICGGDGWDVLCPFLGVVVPDVPFPYKNKTAIG